jgi:spore maturation protein CgeB
MDDVREAGCRNVVYLPFAYKPTVHFPEVPGTAAERSRFASDVVFAGGCDADRLPYLREIVDRRPDIRVTVYGGYWDRDARLRAHHGGTVVGRDYRLAMQGARIALNLVRRANRDGHTMRTFEIPACGGFMLAERTKEHEELFAEGREVAYFTSPAELVEKVGWYLRRQAARARIAAAGLGRIRSGGHAYRDRLLELCRMSGLTS